MDDNSNFFVMQSFAITKLLLDNKGDGFGASYFTHWVALSENFVQVMCYMNH